MKATGGLKQCECHGMQPYLAAHEGQPNINNPGVGGRGPGAAAAGLAGFIGGLPGVPQMGNYLPALPPAAMAAFAAAQQAMQQGMLPRFGRAPGGGRRGRRNARG